MKHLKTVLLVAALAITGIIVLLSSVWPVAAKTLIVRTGSLGVLVQELSGDLDQYFHLEKGQSGVLVTKVFENGPAAKAGIKVGDILTQINDQAIEHVSTLKHALQNLEEKDKDVTLIVWRDGRETRIVVDSAAIIAYKDEGESDIMVLPFDEDNVIFPGSIKDWHKYAHEWRGPHNYLGVYLQDLTEGLREHFRIQEPIGVLISDVVQDSPAEKADLQAGDIVLELDQEKMESADQLKEAIGNKPENAAITLKIQRDGQVSVLKATLETKTGQNYKSLVVPLQENLGDVKEYYHQHFGPELKQNLEELKKQMEELQQEMKELKEELDQAQSH
ncbi:PDZ domain-containing protein [bacterium]|nr:PDZ domain-containing protein [bacterium]